MNNISNNLVVVNNTEIPQEVFLKIIAEFSPSELTGKIALVCKLWNSFALDLNLWETHFMADFGKIFNKIQLADLAKNHWYDNYKITATFIEEAKKNTIESIKNTKTKYCRITVNKFHDFEGPNGDHGLAC